MLHARPVDVRHRVEVEVEQAVEGHELGGGAIVRWEPRCKTVFEDARTELPGCHEGRDTDDDRREQRQELESQICRKVDVYYVCTYILLLQIFYTLFFFIELIKKKKHF